MTIEPMETTLATEALDLPRGTSVTIRLPHRLRVLLRALRIARKSRKTKLYRQLADRDERTTRDLAVDTTRSGHQSWMVAFLLAGGSS